MALSANALYVRRAKKRILQSTDGILHDAGTNGWYIPLTMAIWFALNFVLLILGTLIAYPLKP